MVSGDCDFYFIGVGVHAKKHPDRRRARETRLSRESCSQRHAAAAQTRNARGCRSRAEFVLLMSILSLRNITKKFGQLTAVDNLSIEIAEGELFGLIGQDGAGKTTTMRLMLGIMKPDPGECRVGYFDLAREAESVSTLTGYVSQRFSLYGELSVRENLQLFADLYGVEEADRRRRLERLMQFSRLEPFEER